MSIELNPNVNLDTNYSQYADKFTPDEGYALWRDNETGNLDPVTGEPLCYWLTITSLKRNTEAYAPHIWAKLIDETMEVYGKTNPNKPEVATYGVEQVKKSVH